MNKDWLVLAFAVAVLSFRPCCSEGGLGSEVEVCITRKENGDVFALASGAVLEDPLPCWLAGALCSSTTSTTTRQTDGQGQDNVTPPQPCAACECPSSAPHFNVSEALCEPDPPPSRGSDCPTGSSRVGSNFRSTQLSNGNQLTHRVALLRNQTFGCPGRLEAWSIRLNGHRVATSFYLQVWRMVGSDFNLVGSQFIQVSSSTRESYEDVVFGVSSETLVQPGDFLGVSIEDGIASAPFTRRVLLETSEDSSDLLLYHHTAVSSALSAHGYTARFSNAVANFAALSVPLNQDTEECVLVTFKNKTDDATISPTRTHTMVGPSASGTLSQSKQPPPTPSTTVLLRASSKSLGSTSPSSLVVPSPEQTSLVSSDGNTELSFTARVAIIVAMFVFILSQTIIVVLAFVVRWLYKAKRVSKNRSHSSIEASTSSVEPQAAQLQYSTVEIPSLSSLQSSTQHYLSTSEAEDTYYADVMTDLSTQLNELAIPSNNISLNGELGSGHFGAVHKGLWKRREGELIEVAVKMVKSEAPERSRVKFLQEAVTMSKFDHPNILQIHGIVAAEGRDQPAKIVLDFMSNGDLRSFLLKLRKSSGFSVSNEVSQQFMEFGQQIASGMQYLAVKGFIHRDLAARNIFLSPHFVCKIGDFGMAHDLSDEDYYYFNGGPIPVKWTAPEVLNNKKYTAVSDVWSYGVVLYEIWSVGEKPFPSMHHLEVILHINGGHRLTAPQHCPQDIYRLMLECWNTDPTKRPTFDQVVEMLRTSSECSVQSEENGLSECTCTD